MESKSKLKEVNILNCTCFYFDDYCIDDLDIGNILLNEKLYENYLIYDVAYNTPHGVNSLLIFSIKENDLLENMIALNIWHYFNYSQNYMNIKINFDNDFRKNIYAKGGNTYAAL